ncbi:MAG: hypothetical protein ABFR97_10240 [Thermodesulfobacteriota bacterium]
MTLRSHDIEKRIKEYFPDLGSREAALHVHYDEVTLSWIANFNYHGKHRETHLEIYETNDCLETGRGECLPLYFQIDQCRRDN